MSFSYDGVSGGRKAGGGGGENENETLGPEEADRCSTGATAVELLQQY